MSVCCGRAQSVCEYIARIRVIGEDNATTMDQMTNCNKAIESLGMNVALDVIHDVNKLAEFGASSSPAIVISSKCVSEGRVVPSDEVEKMLRKAIFGI